MEITLQLRADSGNSAVLKQLTEQVKEAAHKAIQEAEHLGEALVKKAHGWAKEMGESITKALEKAASEREKSERKEVPEPTRVSDKPAAAGRELQAHPEVTQQKTPATPAESSRPQEQPDAKKPEGAPAKEEKSTTEKVLGVLHKGTSAAKHANEAASSEKSAVERIAAGAEALEEGHDAIKGTKDVIGVLKKAAAAKEATSAGSTVVQTGTKAVGLGGTIATLGKGALASVGGVGGIVGAAQIAGIGALAVGGGVALHDGVKLLLNKVGFLGGNFDTLSGTVMEWNESTKRSAEIEKKIAETQEAHQKQLEQMHLNQQNTRSVYEARDRIEESQKFQKEAVGMVSVGAHHARRFNAVDPQHVGMERDLQKQDKQYALDDRLFAKETYDKKFAQKEQQQKEAAKTADATQQRNTEWKQKAAGVTDLQEQVLQEEKALKLANEMRDLAHGRTVELQNQLATMDQQVRAAEHQVAAAREQVKAEQDKVNSQKAQLSMLSQDQQNTAAQILKNFNQTKHLSREDALTLQTLGVNKGAIGRAIDATLAQGVDSEFAKQFKKAGGEEDLDKSQQHLKDSTDDLADAQRDAGEAVDEFLDALRDFASSADVAVAAQSKYEDTKADKEGYSHPGDLRPGERPKETQNAVKTVKDAIQASQADFAAAIKEIGDAMVTGAKSNAANLRGVATQLNGAHK
ncbi:MAG TPA: hypothetical protein VGP63_13605 [Planctomycetaceae bacterium]|jgi:hypothetical protein|nr:hypothetical protein [Planctomycetaceae bacterium]